MQTFHPNGSANDDTAGFQAAVLAAANDELEIASGDLRLTGPVTISAEMALIFRKGARLLIDHASCDVLSVEAEWVRLIEPRIEAMQARTGGAYVRLKQSLANRFESEGGLLTGYWTGLAVEDVSTVTIDDLSCLGGIDGHGSAIEITGGFDLSISNLLCDAGMGFRPAAGVLVTACGDLLISGSGIMHHGVCISVTPAAGQSVTSLWVTETFLDNSTRGIFINAAGSVLRTKLSDVWTSSHAQQGILAMTQNGGLIDGLEISGCHAFLNAQNGIQLQGNILNAQIRGGKFGGNALSGIAIGTGPQHTSIQGVRSGLTDAVGQNGGWGCIVYASGQNYLRIENNDFIGNTAGGLMDQSGAVTKNIGGNFV